MSARYLVTAALPYANGPIHIGHAIGCYIPADVYTRYHRLQGDEVIYICGTDEHGTPISVTAEQEGIDPQDVVKKYHDMHLDAFSGIRVEFTNFSGTARQIHIENSQDFFKTVAENGYVYKKTVRRPYCEGCKRFLPDRYVRGSCPQCESEDQRGDQCEKCGKQLEPHELLDPICSICGDTPVMQDTEHWFFKLTEVSEDLRKWIEENKHWPPNARNFALGWIREGLQDRAITRDLSWGVPVPEEGADGKVLYVWFDAPIGYISSTMEWSQAIGKSNEWEKFWKDDETKIVHFIGKDNIPFHAIIWPGVLMAHRDYTLPYQIASNEYLTLEGEKMSTSRGWVLWLHDCIAEFDPEILRYYLLSITPQSSDSDFSLTELMERGNNELLATLGNLVNRVLTFIGRSGGQIPEPVEFDDDDKKLIEFMERQPDIIAGYIESLNFINGLSSMMALAHEGNKYFQKKQPWKNEGGNTLYLCANLIRNLSIVMEPFLPGSAERIWEMMQLSGSVHEQSWEGAKGLKVEAGHKIGKPKGLYKKIEAEQIEDFAKRHLPGYEGKDEEDGKAEKPGKAEGKAKKAKGKAKKEEKPKKAGTVSFDRFAELDIRTAKIVEVADHPNADKLYVLRIDVGELGERTIVAGIRGRYKSEQLIGRSIVIIANLSPAKIRGVESQGMLLAATPEGGPILLAPSEYAPPGTKVG